MYSSQATTCYWMLGFCIVLTSLSGSQSQQVTIANVGHPYPVDVGAENHIVQGRISAEAEAGTLIPSNVVFEGKSDADTRLHLRVEIRNSVYTRPHLYHPENKLNTSDPANPQFNYPVVTFENQSLPYGMQFVVVHTDAFIVNEDRYIVVNDFSHLEEATRIHFDVLLKDKLAETRYVSNQLPFVVEIDYPVNGSNPNAALFAGVLILVIVGISLIIPFVVRAKRRSKAGKPICACGHADDASDKESLDHGKHKGGGHLGKDNLAMILDNGRMMQGPNPEEYTTIQNRMLRSTSSIHFQPQWMDPHYHDIYRRPDFSNMRVHHGGGRMSSGATGHHGAGYYSRENSNQSTGSNSSHPRATFNIGTEDAIPSGSYISAFNGNTKTTANSNVSAINSGTTAEVVKTEEAVVQGCEATLDDHSNYVQDARL